MAFFGMVNLSSGRGQAFSRQHVRRGEKCVFARLWTQRTT